MIILYVLEGCPYCNNSISILEKYKLKYKVITVENNTESKNYYKKLHGMQTFPQIFIQSDKNIIKIGGNDDLVETFEICNYIKKSNVSIDSIYNIYKNLYK